MNTLTTLEDLVGNEYLEQSSSNFTMDAHNEKNNIQANNNRIVDLTDPVPVI